MEAIEKEFHSFEAMRNELSAAAVAMKVVFAFLLFYFKTSIKYQPFHLLPILMIDFTPLTE